MTIPETAKLVGGVVAGVLAVVGMVGNAATLWAIGRNKTLRKQPTTVLMLSLTTADLFFTGVVLPFEAQSNLYCW